MEPSNDKHLFGFWVYLMTDLIMFAALFAAYAVLRDATFGGPGAGQLFSINNALAETLILLTSSFTCGLAMLAAVGFQIFGDKNPVSLTGPVSPPAAIPLTQGMVHTITIPAPVAAPAVAVNSTPILPP